MLKNLYKQLFQNSEQLYLSTIIDAQNGIFVLNSYWQVIGFSRIINKKYSNGADILCGIYYTMEKNEKVFYCYY